MRRMRRLLLAAILAVLAAVGVVYFAQRRDLQASAQPPPASLPDGIQAAADDWHWSRTIDNRPAVELRARNFQQVGEKTELEGVELKLYQADGVHFDRVTSKAAVFDTTAGTLYSDGEVEITMGMAEPGAKPGRIVNIRSSGVTYDNKTGKVATDRLATFSLDTGDGKAVGAGYDPVTRELHLKSQVELHWKGHGPQSKPMKVETGELVYREKESNIVLSPWSRLTRETMVLNGGNATVELEEGAIRKVDTVQAHGEDNQPQRKLEYAADHLIMLFTKKSEMEKLTGEQNARLVSTSPTAVTNINSDRVDLDFVDSEKGSTLRKALATGKAVVESRPVPRKDAPTPDTRILRSETIEMEMRPGGEEIDSVSTHAAGKLEFLPNQPKGRKRTMDGDRMWISYGRNNQIETFRSVQVATRTEGDPEAKPPVLPQLTWSKDMKAEFDQKTGELSRLEQWNDFRYEQGPRHAKADKALLESAADRITLEGLARVWDATGSTSGDRIVLNQKSGDFTAEGKVASTRQPEKKKEAKPAGGAASPGMLSGDSPLQARAQKMTSTDNNRKIAYEGGAVLWQGANRIEAQRVDIDRANEGLHARGSVVSNFLDNPPVSADAGKKKAQPLLTVVKAPELVYTGKDKMAYYTGGVLLERPGMEVRSAELRAFLKEDKDETTLERAIADGNVRILEKAVDRTRTGTGEHGEYYVADNKLILTGGSPLLVDSLRGSTRGKELTYFANNDRLLVDGAGQPAVSRIQRK
jgi:lipopolysaccharide export system protein LptA